MVSCPLCGESHRKDDKTTCERIQGENSSIMMTRGRGKPTKSTEDLEAVTESLHELSLEECEQKARTEIERIEAEIRVQALEAKMAELKKLKARSSLQIPTTSVSDEKKTVRSSLEDYTLPAPSWRSGEVTVLDGFTNLSEPCRRGS